MKYKALVNICHNNVDLKPGDIFEANSEEIPNLIKGNLVEELTNVPVEQPKEEPKPSKKKGKEQ